MNRIPGRLRPEGSLGVAVLGHRNYVGGLWDELGKLQFEFMVAQGLRPHHVFLDVACGSLRGGRLFIPYLDRGNYLGLDKERGLIRAGLRKEIDPKVASEKAPEFVVSDSFEFDRFSKRPEFALAQSLFTHLAPPDIHLCLRRLRASVAAGTRFFATFFVAPDTVRNPATSGSHKGFFYPRATAESFGESEGWEPRFIGDWHHPRGQQMVEYVAR